jgi:hypothetical protein
VSVAPAVATGAAADIDLLTSSAVLAINRNHECALIAHCDRLFLQDRLLKGFAAA